MQQGAELLEQTTEVYQQVSELAPLAALGLIGLAALLIGVSVARRRKRGYYD